MSIAAWDTWCGWRFAERNVKVTLMPNFITTTKKCKKCETAFQARDVVKGGVSLVRLVKCEKDTDDKGVV